MDDSVKKVFSSIYDSWGWGPENESRSGAGSSLAETEIVRSKIPELIKKYKIKTIFDASCGDFNWMRHVDLAGVKYTGADIVEDLIIQNQQKYSNENINFVSLDVMTDELPKSDLIILRDTLFHFSNDQIFKTLKNIKRSGSSLLLTTSYFEKDHLSDTNSDIEVGDWRYLNLELEPFFLKKPIERIFEVPWLREHSDRTLSLWTIKSLPS